MSIEQKKQHKNLKAATDVAELDARYFRAQFESKFYFMKNKEIEGEFNALVAKLQAEEIAKTQEAPTDNLPEGSFQQSAEITENANTEE